jgi:hypothetical protein
MSAVFTIDQTDNATGYRVHGTLTIEEPAPPAPPFLLGVDFPPSMAAAHRTLFPNYRYRRLFADTTWAELPAMLAQEPAEVLAHVSAKQHTEASLDGLLDGLERDIWLTYYHEPMGNVTPATYRTTAAAVAAQIAAHPNGHRVLLNGPNLTRYWIDQAAGQGQGNPNDFWYDGANAFFNDCYTGGALYRTPSNMFDNTIAYAESRGVPWAVPELGGQRIASDTEGSVRAQWLRNLVDYAADHGCLAMAWFCKGTTGHLENYPAELAAWQELLTDYA